MASEPLDPRVAADQEEALRRQREGLENLHSGDTEHYDLAGSEPEAELQARSTGGGIRDSGGTAAGEVTGGGSQAELQNDAQVARFMPLGEGVDGGDDAIARINAAPVGDGNSGPSSQGSLLDRLGHAVGGLLDGLMGGAAGHGAAGGTAAGGASASSPPLQGGGQEQGEVTEDLKSEVSGQLSAQGGHQTHYIPERLSGRFGDLVVDTDGHWKYELRPDQPNDPGSVQHLNNGDTYRETFFARLTDVTGRQIQVPVVISVHGTDDAAVISGVRTGTLTENQGLQGTSGVLVATDIDRGDVPSFVPQSVKGTYGSFALQADGHWSYTADPQKIQGLKDGQQVVDSFPVSTTNAAGESAQATVAIAIVGTDDKAVFPPVSVTAKEDGGMVTGHLLATDADAKTLSYGVAPGALPVAGVSVDADGTVHVDPSRPEYQGLAVGEHRDLQVPVQVTDERGVSVQSMLTVRIEGTNDAPVVTVHPPVPADEGSGVHSTQVLARDVDGSDKLSYGLPASGSLPPGVSLDGATGQVSIDTSHGAYNHLAVGEVQTVVVPVVVSDGHGGSTSTQVTFEVRGTNDAPVLAAIGQQTATEGGAPISGQLSGSDPDSSDKLSYGLAGGVQAPAGFTIQLDGHWRFDPQDPAYNSLRAGEHQQILIPLDVSDGHGGSSRQSLAIDLVGSNDGAVIGGTSSGAVREDQTLQAAGVLSVADPDAGEAQFRSTVLSGNYGQLHLNTDGSWTYTLDNANPKVQALPDGGTLTDRLVVFSADGTSHQISITVTGTDDAAQVSGSHSGQVTEDLITSASGQLTVTDIDQGETPRFQGETLQGIYGQLSIDASGHWNYQLDPATSQELQAGVKARESFTVLASDGKGHQVSQQILVDVTGSNDAARISGTATGQVREDTLTQASGKLDVLDVDRGEARFQTGDQSGAYGTLHLDADGSWRYALDNANPKVQALPDGSTATDTFTVRSADGTTHQVMLRISGSNDAAVISGTSSGQVREDSQLTVSGKLDVVDVDTGEAHFQTGDQSGAYGTLHLDADGSWRYALDNTNPKVQALAAGASATETFTVRSADGTTHQVNVQVGGSNDAPTISGTSTGRVTEDATLQASGRLQIVDADQGESSLDPTDVGDKVGTYGTLHVNADGSWSYQLNNSARVVQDLQAGNTRQDTFTVHSADGTSQQLQLTVVGASDAPVLTAGQISGGREDNSLVLTSDAILKALQATDPDGDRLSVASVSYTGGDATLVDNRNGTWTLTPHANWSGNLQFQVGVSDGHDVTTGSLTVPIAAVADKATMTVAPSLSSTFEDPTLGGQAYHFADPLQWGWHTDNVSGLVEQGKGETYGDPNHANTGLIELEGNAGEADNLYRVLDTQPGASYHFSLDVSGRTGISGDSAAVQVLWEGKVIDTIRPADNTFGLVRHEYDLTAHTEHPRIEFRALTHDGSGPIVDNPNFEFRGFNGTEDTELPIKLSVETVDKDGSETITAGIKGLPAGFAITDGTTGHRLTSNGTTQTLDMQGWDLEHLKVVPVANFNGRVDAVLIATTTESSNHDQAVIQIPVPLNFAAVNDPPTVRISTSGALAEDSTETRTEQITATDLDGDATSIDTSWLVANHWSTSDSGRTYTKAGTFGTATLTIATNQVSYQLNNTPGGPTDHLADGQNGRDAFEVQITDGHGGSVSGTAIFNVTGTNDAPTVTAGVASATLTEGRSDTATSILTMRDPDSTDPSPSIDTAWLTANGWTTSDGGTTYTKAGTYGSASLLTAAGTVTYRLDNAAGGSTDQLKAGDSVQDAFSIQVKDHLGLTAMATPSFSITGTNDAPVLQAQSQSVTEDGHLLTGQMLATDIDSGDTQTFSIPNAVPGLTFNADGSYSFDPTHADYQSLKAGETKTLAIPVTVTDASGATSHQNLTITVTGTNDAPVLSAQSKTATEDGSVVTGQMVATDSDRGDTPTFSIANPVAGLSFQADGSYRFDPSDAAYQSLKAGETRTLTIPVTVTDGSGANTQQNLTITVTGTNEAPTVTADTTAHSATLTSAREDTSQTYSSAYLLGQVGAGDSDSDVAHLSVTDVHVDPTYGSFRASVTPSGTTDWIFTPAANYSGTSIPITLTIKDAQGGVTTAHAQTSVSSVTDTATPALTVSVEHEVMLFGSQAKPAATNNSHVYAEVGGGQITQATFEVISVGDPAHRGDPTASTGPVILNLATDNNNNLVSFWRPANLSVAFNGTDYSTDRNLAAGVTGGINMTSGTHRVTATWDSATGTLNIYDNGKLHNTFTNVLQRSHLDVTTAGLLTLGQKMNDPTHLGGFRENEQFNGQIFSASFGTKALSVHDIESGPMANLPAATSSLQANFQARNGAVTNELSGPSGSTSSFHTGTISFETVAIDVSAMPPPVGATLKLALNVAAPSDTDDTISRQWLRGLPVGTVLSDGSGHQLTVGSNTLVNLTADTHDWVLTNGLVAQLPAGYNTNLPLQLVAETTGPDGSIARSRGDALIVFNPDGTKTLLGAPTDADLGVAPPPPPPTSSGLAAAPELEDLLQHLHSAGLDVTPTQPTSHHTEIDPVTGASREVLEVHTAHGTVVQTLTPQADGSPHLDLDTSGLDAEAQKVLPTLAGTTGPAQPQTSLIQQADAPEHAGNTENVMDHSVSVDPLGLVSSVQDLIGDRTLGTTDPAAAGDASTPSPVPEELHTTLLRSVQDLLYSTGPDATAHEADMDASLHAHGDVNTLLSPDGASLQDAFQDLLQSVGDSAALHSPVGAEAEVIAGASSVDPLAPPSDSGQDSGEVDPTLPFDMPTLPEEPPQDFSHLT